MEINTSKRSIPIAIFKGSENEDVFTIPTMFNTSDFDLTRSEIGQIQRSMEINLAQVIEDGINITGIEFRIHFTPEVVYDKYETCNQKIGTYTVVMTVHSKERPDLTVKAEEITADIAALGALSIYLSCLNDLRVMRVEDKTKLDKKDPLGIRVENKGPTIHIHLEGVGKRNVVIHHPKGKNKVMISNEQSNQKK